MSCGILYGAVTSGAVGPLGGASGPGVSKWPAILLSFRSGMAGLSVCLRDPAYLTVGEDSGGFVSLEQVGLRAVLIDSDPYCSLYFLLTLA